MYLSFYLCTITYLVDFQEGILCIPDVTESRTYCMKEYSQSLFVPSPCRPLFAVVHYLHLVQIWDDSVSVSFMTRYTLHFPFGEND